MSELKSRNASQLKAFAASELNAFGSGFKTLFLPRTSNVLMEWSCEFLLYDATTDTVLSTVPGIITLHERWYHTSIWLMGSGNGRGVCSVGALLVRAFSAGTPNIDTDLHSSNGLTVYNSVTEVRGNNYIWNGYSAIDALPAVAGHIDTGTTMEFYGETVLFGVGTPAVHPIAGAYFFSPNVLGPYLNADDWIMFYCTGAGGLQVTTVTNNVQVRVRIKCVLTV